MIDTISLHINLEDLTDYQVSNIEQLITNKEIRTKEDGKRSVSGNLRNFKVYINWSGISLRGSLSRFFYGSNQYSLNYLTIPEAINELNKTLGIDLYPAKVKEVHIAENFILKYDINDYFKSLGNKPRYKRLERPNGVGYKAGNFDITFYNKIKEVKSRRELILPIFEHKNVLRLEYRFLRHSDIASFLKLKTVTLEELVAKYNKLVERWAEAFQSVHKIHSKILIDPSIFAIKSGFEQYVMINGIEALGGILEISEFIARGKRNGYFKKYPNESSNMLNKFKKLSSMPLLTNPSHLVDELERKVNLIKFYHTYIEETRSIDVSA